MKVKNIKLLTASREIFFSCLNKFKELNIFTGPSVYFHKRVIKLIRNNNFEELLNNSEFIELIYATLVSWGMHRMGSKGPKMQDFKIFKDSIIDNIEELVDLNKYRIEKISIDEREIIKLRLVSILQKLNVMQGSSYIVGCSKTLHNLLPDLVPPIDGEYTLRFFYGSKSYNPGREDKKFEEIFENYWSICKKLSLTERDYLDKGEFTTSIPKLIDNAIVGFIKSNLK